MTSAAEKAAAAAIGLTLSDHLPLDHRYSHLVEAHPKCGDCRSEGYLYDYPPYLYDRGDGRCAFICGHHAARRQRRAVAAGRSPVAVIRR